MRGWSHNIALLADNSCICPAYAGMILMNGVLGLTGENLSRVCGDDPHSKGYRGSIKRFVPRMRGWSLSSRILLLISLNLSRVCGDDPPCDFLKNIFVKFVPRMRGWSLRCPCPAPCKEICPAYAGMILQSIIQHNKREHLSRVCGDDPMHGYFFIIWQRFVPRMRGWSCSNVGYGRFIYICPAYAGMIHGKTLVTIEGNTFVPRMRGWSLLRSRQRIPSIICPAYAGMILE